MTSSCRAHSLSAALVVGVVASACTACTTTTKYVMPATPRDKNTIAAEVVGGVIGLAVLAVVIVAAVGGK